MLGQPVALHNIRDAEAFVRHCIRKGRILLTVDQEDDLVAEGLAILCDLATKYDRAKDQGGSGSTEGFFGYALYLLPRKLGDAWHRSQPHHLLVTQPDGSRRYEYLRPDKSLEEHAETHQLEAPSLDLEMGVASSAMSYHPPGSIASAVALMPTELRIGAYPVLQNIEQGYNHREIAQRLSLKQSVVTHIKNALATAMWQLQEAA